MNGMVSWLFEAQEAINAHNGNKLSALHRQFMRIADPNDPEDVSNWDILIQEIENNQGKMKAIQSTNLVLGLFDDEDMLTKRAASRCQSYFRELVNEFPMKTWCFAAFTFGASDMDTPLAKVYETLTSIYTDDAIDADENMLLVLDTVNQLNKQNGYTGRELKTGGCELDFKPLKEMIVPLPRKKASLLAATR